MATRLHQPLLPQDEPEEPPVAYSIADHSLRRLRDHTVAAAFTSSSADPSPTWTQSPATRALRNIGAGTTEAIFGSKGSIQSCIMTLASCTIGTGVLALPAAFVEVGFISGLLFIVLSVAFNVWTCLLLVHCCMLSNRYSYRRIGVAAFGPKGGMCVKIGVVFVLFGIITALQVVLSDSLHKVAFLFTSQPASKWMLSGVAIAVTILPLSLPSNISALRYTSMLALSSILYVTAVVVICGVMHVNHIGGLEESITLAVNETGSFWGPQGTGSERMLNVITNIPVFMMAFACQVQVPDIFHTMPKKMTLIDVGHELVQKKVRSVIDMKWVVVGALSTVCVMYLLLGVSGALAFVGHWNDLKGDVLIGLGSTTKNMTLLSNIDAARVVMCVSVSLTCPLLVLPCRDTLLQLFGLDWSSGSDGSGDGDEDVDGEEEEEEEELRMARNRKLLNGHSPSKRSPLVPLEDFGGGGGGGGGGASSTIKWPCSRLVSHSLVTAGLLLTTWCLANSISNLKLVLGFTGSTGGCLLLYMLPAIFYLKLLSKQRQAKPPSWSALLFGWVPLILGTVVMIVATGATVYFVTEGTTDTNTTTIG